MSEAPLTVFLVLLTMVLAAVSAMWLDRATERRGVLPPGFARPGRRTAALLWTGFVFFFLFSPLATIGVPREPVSAEALRGPMLFSAQALLVVGVIVWFLLGYAGIRWPPAAPPPVPPVDDEPPPEPSRPLPLVPTFLRQFGLKVERPGREIAIGFGATLAAYAGLLMVMLVVIALFLVAGQKEHIPTTPPELVPLLAGLPIALRIALSLSAGVVEELFFRGFLQARLGILGSTVLFVIAHLTYGQPFMLIGITVLSLFFSALVAWRRSILAAVVAHFAFDAFQLLFVIPQVLRGFGEGT